MEMESKNNKNNKTNNKTINNKPLNIVGIVVNRQNGYSLVELVIVTIIGLIIVAATAKLYIAFVDVHNREQRVLVIQRNLQAINTNLQKSLSTLPGRGLATTNGTAFSLPTLPSIGTTRDSFGKTVPIRLGIITPYKLNGYDAFTVAYTDAKIPRLPIASVTKVNLTTGKLLIALPQAIPAKPPTIIRGGTVGGISGGTIGGLTSSSIKVSDNSGQTSNIIIPPHTPTPTPSPTQTPTPTHTPVPPNIPFTSTILGETWIPDVSMFHTGDTMLMVNEPTYSDTQSTTTQTASRLVQITGVRSITPTLNQGGQYFIELTFDYCGTGDCGTQFPGLINTVDAPTVGTALIPLRLTSYYVKSDSMGTRIIRNDGGVPTVGLDGNVVMRGGIEDMQGELLGNLGTTANFSVLYHLQDGTIQPTPINPAVPWLSTVDSVDVNITSQVPGAKGKELISHQVVVSFTTIMKTLE